MLNIAVLVSGGGTNLQALIQSIEDGTLTGVKIAGVISSNSRAFALERAKKHGIPAKCVSPKDFESQEAFTHALLAALEEMDVGLIVLAGFLVVLAPEIIKRFKGRIINVHPSLIPSFCGKGCYGLKVHEAALARGVKVTGATVHIVDEGTDTGPILLQKAVEVRDDDTPETLQRRVMEQAEWVLLPQAVQMIADKKFKG